MQSDKNGEKYLRIKFKRQFCLGKKRLQAICDENGGHFDHLFNYPEYVNGIVQ